MRMTEVLGFRSLLADRVAEFRVAADCALFSRQPEGAAAGGISQRGFAV
jgi:hypothetical protein